MELTTAREVIDALGGYGTLALLCGAKRSAVGNWQTQFPADRYVQMQKLLHDRGYEAPSTLWRQKP